MQSISNNDYQANSLHFNKNPHEKISYVSNSQLNQSSIDQHRNSIQQRIANLQAKLMKKTTQKDNPYLNSQFQKNAHNNLYEDNKAFRTSGEYQSRQGKFDQVYQRNDYCNELNRNIPPINHVYTSNNNNNALKSMNYGKPLDQIALRERKSSNSNIAQKFKFQNQYSKRNNEKINNINKLNNKLNNQQQVTLIKHNLSSQKIKQSMLQKQNTKNSFLQSKSKLDQQIIHQNPFNYTAQNKNAMHNKTNNIQENFNQLNKTISNLRTFTGVPLPYHKEQNNLSSLYLNNTMAVNPLFLSKNQNNQLFQMMKSILAGQQKLEKQLQQLKNTEKSSQNLQRRMQNDKNQQSYKLLKQNLKYEAHKKQTSGKYSPLAQKNNISKSRSKSKSAKKRKSYSPMSSVPSHRSKSPNAHGKIDKKTYKLQKFVHNLINQTTNKEDLQFQNTSSIKRKRVSSAINYKSKVSKESISKGVIKKNKTKFNELYEQALRSRRLNTQVYRVEIKKETISNLWGRIQSVIKRSERQNRESSRINHENNKFVNDHLINTIELQKKQQGQTTKKIYEMCSNKCLYK